MRRIASFVSLVAPVFLLSGCTGLGMFLDRTVARPGGNPNGPTTDSVNLRRALGQTADMQELEPQPGNIWPGPQKSDPTLIDLQRDEGSEAARGFARTSVPATAVPGDPDHRQPRPVGSATPLLSFKPKPEVPPPTSSVPGPGPVGSVVPTPQGPAIDAGGTPSYRQLLTPRGPGAIMVPNGNGTSTVLEPGGSVQTVPRLR